MDTIEITQKLKEHIPPATPGTDDENPICFNDTTNDSIVDYESDTSFSYQFHDTSLTGLLQNC